MEKKQKKTKENDRNKTAIRLIRKGKERKRTLLYCQLSLLAPRQQYMWHCKLKLIQINQVESNQMQVLEESGKPKYPGKQKTKKKSREPTNFKSN